MLLLINERDPEHYREISGLDRLFIAPELRKYGETSELNDVWSIGVILYLLITGGASDKKNVEKFDFKEE